MLIVDGLSFRVDDTVLLLRACQDPSQIVQRHFSIIRDKEQVVLSTETSVKIKNTTVFKVENHVSVEAPAVEQVDHQELEESQVNTDTRVAVVRVFKEIVG